MATIHQPVLLTAIMEYLKPAPGQCIIDCTLGGGGYTTALARAVGPTGQVFALEIDPDAIARATASGLPDNVVVINASFKDLAHVFQQRINHPVDAVVLDLGLSSDQLVDPTRGFSFASHGPLDFRFDPATSSLTGFEIIDTWSAAQLAELFRTLGDERLAGPIAFAIVKQRQTEPVTTTSQLAIVIEGVYAKHFKKPSRLHPATKVWQALRLAVNDELGALRAALPAAVEILRPGGKLAVVAFHSGEDRIVKEFFRQASRDCRCQSDAPVCQCGGQQATLTVVTKKPVRPSPTEIAANPRARSAKLRVAQKCS
ncbi:MAG: 16S rRNA (cytosine(1402)-N(4))-methyltransferase RsmH [Patescibacteria group bacterium]